MGDSVYSTEVNKDTPNLRAYSHVSKTGGVAMILINLSNDTMYEVDV